MKDKIFAIVKKPGGDCEIRLVESDPKVFGGVVEGKRELIPFPAMPGVCVIFDGEAAQNKKKPNCFLPEYNDLLVGTVVFAGLNLETGFVSLTAAQADRIEAYTQANDARGFSGNAEARIAAEYLPHNEENYVYGLLCEVKTKYKSLKLKWIGGKK
jgi:hypothetical protein